MLLDAKLSKEFWAEAVQTAVYLKNRSPSRSLRGMTPHEAWFGEKPKVKHFRVFGCDAFAHIPRDERGKFDPKTRKCILVGYSLQSKAYCLYDFQRKKLIVSRDVKFNEEEKGIQMSSEHETDRDEYITIETTEENTDIGSAAEPERQTEEESPQEQQVRRSARERHPPKYYGRSEQTHLADSEDPTTFEEAISSADKAK